MGERVVRSWCIGAMAALAACAAADGENGLSRTNGASPGEAGSSDMAGAAAPGPGGFANPTGPAPNLGAPQSGSGGTPAASGECAEGQFCAPKGPDGNCGTVRFDSDVEITTTPGNLLVIFDQSGSMNDDWTGGSSKLQAAQNALVQALTPLQDLMTAGAIFFPSAACVPFFPPPPGGAVQPIDGPQQIAFMPGPQFLQAWSAHWNNRVLLDNLGTPMQEAFDRADAALQSAMLTGPLSVVAFTDGEPNCFNDPAISMTGPTLPEPERAASWLMNRSVKTYMVGLPGANGVQILNDVAASGGTTMYILPDDPAELEAKLREVVQETVSMGFDSCTITLDPVPQVPDELLMIVDEPMVGRQQVPRDRGWALNAQGTVELSGALCDDAMAGRFTSITFEYACPDVPPPPTLPPVE